MDELPAALAFEQEITLLMQQLTAQRVDLSSKHRLTVEESAFYRSVSRSQFDSHIAEHLIEARNFTGEKFHQKAPLMRGHRVQPAILILGKSTNVGVTTTAFPS